MRLPRPSCPATTSARCASATRSDRRGVRRAGAAPTSSPAAGQYRAPFPRRWRSWRRSWATTPATASATSRCRRSFSTDRGSPHGGEPTRRPPEEGGTPVRRRTFAGRKANRCVACPNRALRFASPLPPAPHRRRRIRRARPTRSPRPLPSFRRRPRSRSATGASPCRSTGSWPRNRKAICSSRRSASPRPSALSPPAPPGRPGRRSPERSIIRPGTRACIPRSAASRGP